MVFSPFPPSPSTAPSSSFLQTELYLVSGLLLRDVCSLIESAIGMSSQQAPMSPPYRPTSPPRGILFSPVYCPSFPPGCRAWGSERFPDSFHLECPHPNCPGVLAPGHQLEETFAPICPGSSPWLTSIMRVTTPRATLFTLYRILSVAISMRGVLQTFLIIKMLVRFWKLKLKLFSTRFIMGGWWIYIRSGRFRR